MNSNAGGLIVHRGSRTERLADTLAELLEAERPPHPLTAQTVVVAHPGLKRWLLGRIAHRPSPHGGHGIAANIEMILPWQWFERVARRTLGDEALIGGAYRSDVLRWRLLMALPTLGSAEVSAYLAGDDAARRGFQLAEYLAGLYTQYLTYRPDWILDWEQHPAKHARDWQAALWRQVQQTINRPHRAKRSGALLDALQTDGHRDSTPLHVFGISHLPPDVLAALQACALHRPVHLYFPDPCREHWVYLRRQRFLLERQNDPDALYFEVGHPLLVALGRIAQDFCLTLDDCDAIDERDALDEAEPLPGETSLLAQLQSSIRCLQPELVGESIREAIDGGESAEDVLPALRNDASLRVHACHTRLRELEVLKNALLRALADEPSLQHRDIVVMAPDIGAYAPYLAAVFGEQAQYRSDPRHIPWHLADVGLARAHPLMSAFTQAFDLAESRFTVSEVMDFLDVPAVARRFGIDRGSRDALERWLQRAHVAWGLDAEMKEDVGAAATDANSWQFGLDRLYAGLIVGRDSDVSTDTVDSRPDGQISGDILLDDILPLDGVAGGAVEAIGQLDRLLGELRAMRQAFGSTRSLAAWSQWLLERIDALFLADMRDEAENSALDTLRRVAASLGSQASETGLGTPLPWSVVREAVGGALDAVPERQAFLLGGVTFCGLVPQRSIPFRVVCLLGMNEGEFPRPSKDAGLNKIIQQPRRGDRDTRSEDRYLFLEATMSARDMLHISYIGEGVRDGKPRNPAAPLAELLQFLDEQHGVADDEDVDRPWCIHHPLQPFDARYYERDAQGRPLHDPRLFSYDEAYLATPSAASIPRFLPMSDFIANPDDRERASSADVIRHDVSLASLKRYWRDPVKNALLRGHGISLQALESASWHDREPLETGLVRIERIEHRLLFDALAGGATELPAEPPAWLSRSGLLASGAIGAEAYRRQRASLQPMLQHARDKFADGMARPATQAIDLDLGDGVRLAGTIDRVFHATNGGLLLFDAKPVGSVGLREALAMYIDWAALRLSSNEPLQAALLASTPSGKIVDSPLLDPIVANDTDALRVGLRRLIDLAHAADRRPLLFFPKTALAYALSAPDERIYRTAAVWEGNDFSGMGERDYAPGYAALISRGVDLFDEKGAAYQAFVAATKAVCDVLDPSHRLLFKSVDIVSGAEA
ncbi:exodeoxyribonuclease V gamma subunit [Rhodanobacter sp. K2T2]|uniref:exodeoxyribonuclease V subunit gamma n=1 Tax=Rhodanobacter sp. K2T2 TaxID=2723085 RepID=UPI0015C8CDE7|nr:exodeoxyribonuclease V subunit gamma [Rhodanobacter sp. K2T2]NYE30605.1 exodeoxyribonuclease V gamma subunit [Rhodanobacter sp. K2T2]